MPAERFGVEIECGFTGGASYASVARAMSAERLEVVNAHDRHYGYDEHKWMITYDSTVEGGCEVKSPPLKFRDASDRAQVDAAVRAMNSAGCQVVNEAGIHVHVSASDLDAFQLANVCRFVWKFEDVLYRIASSGWEKIRDGAMNVDEDEGFAKPLRPEMVDLMKKVRTMKDLQAAWTGENWNTEGDRYHAVNLNSYWAKGTVEFRLFNSSLFAPRIQAYIAMSAAIVRDARNGQSRSVAKSYPLGYMAANPHMQKKLLQRFRQVMTCSTSDGTKSKMADNPPLMSKEDWKLVLMCWNDSRPQVHPHQYATLSRRSDLPPAVEEFVVIDDDMEENY